MLYPAQTKTIDYVLAKTPLHIQHASQMEREGFGTGIDPQELPEVLKYISNNGWIWLQYAREGGQKKPTGVIELLPLEAALSYDPKSIKTKYDIGKSPLTVIAGNQEEAFKYARRFTSDKNIVYHHGISMSRQGQGYGTILLNHALGNTPNIDDKVVVAFVDAAKLDEESGEMKPTPNELSYTIHLKRGFVLAGVVGPPVYDDTVSYYSVVRNGQSSFQFVPNSSLKVRFNDANVSETISIVRRLTSVGYVGVSYDRKAHEMTFMKLK